MPPRSRWRTSPAAARSSRCGFGWRRVSRRLHPPGQGDRIRASTRGRGRDEPGHDDVDTIVLYFDGGPKSSGGSSICGTSILIVLGSMFDCTPLECITIDGNVITSATMMIW